MVCERCKHRDALHPQMIIYGTTGAFCADCLGDLTRAFFDHHPEIMATMPPGLTVEQVVAGQLQMMQAGLSATDPSDPTSAILKPKQPPE